jgi:excisionase family DNA binding protein
VVSVQSKQVARVAEVARAWGVSPATIRRWFASGLIQGIRVGKTIRIYRAELDRLQAGESRDEGAKASVVPCE